MDLWNRFIVGDERAFTELMDAYVDMLFRYGTRCCQDEELVRDTIQELFIKLWERRRHLGAEANAKAYLFASLRRMLFRKMRQRPETIPYPDFENFENLFAVELSVEQRLIRRERVQSMEQQLKRKMALLPVRQKEVVYLRFFENMKREQICDIMKIRPQTVSNLLQNALGKLRASF